MTGKAVPERAESGENPGRFRVPRWALVIIFVLTGFAVFGDNGVLRLMQAEEQKKALETEIKQLQEVRSGLLREIDSLNNDPRHIENIARKELGMVKDDELVYQFSPSALSKTGEVTGSAATSGK